MSFLYKQSSDLPANIGAVFRRSELVVAYLPCRFKVDGPGLDKGYAVLVKAQEGQTAAVFLVGTHGYNTRITHILPIDHRFSLSLNQTPPSPSVSHFHQSSRQHIGLSLWSSRGKVDLRISAGESARTQVMVNELRRLLAISKSRPSSPLSASWLGYYPKQHPSPDTEDDDLPPTPSESTSTLTTPSIATSNLESPLESLTRSNQAEAGPNSKDAEPNPLLPGSSRISYLRKKVFARQDEWSSRQLVKIRIATYNVNDKLPPEGTIELPPVVGQGTEDILVFGFQEVDLRSSAMFVSQGNARSDIWQAAILRSLGDKAKEYTCIATTQYVGVMMLIFARNSLKEYITGVETSEKGIGLLGFGGNKAGVAVQMKVHDTTFCFVNSHLAAFANALDRRRADYHTLLTGLGFPCNTGSEDVLALEEFGSDTIGRPAGVEECHTIFWLGDLNYRIDEDDEVLKAWVKEERWRQILEKDQLKADIASEKSFGGYQEGEIDFPPSYKYVHGSSTLDTRRAPAYTDRILWKQPRPRWDVTAGSSRSTSDHQEMPASDPTPASAPASTSSPTPSVTEVKEIPLPVRCDRYESHPTLLWSDHRPVSASFSTEVRVPDDAKRKRTLIEARRELEKLEAVWRPALEVERTEIDFGEIRYRRQYIQDITLRNTGRVPARFSFKEPSAGKSMCKPYYWVIPSNGEIQAGQSVTLRVVLYVHEGQARNLTAGEDMGDVLVLQVENGKDIFITLSATFLPTIIGLPLILLPELSSHIGAMPLSERRHLAASRPAVEGAPPTPEKGAKKDETAGGTKSAREIWRLLEYLMEFGLGEQLWIKQDGDDEAVLDVIEAIDTCSDLPPRSAISVSSALLHILQALPDPLIPQQWHSFCLAAKGRDEAFACLEGIEGVHTNVLIGLMSVVRLCNSATANDGDTGAGAIDVLADTVFGMTSSTSGSDTNEGRARFVRLLLGG